MPAAVRDDDGRHRNGRTIIDPLQHPAIRDAYAKGGSTADLATTYGVSRRRMMQVVKGIRPAHRPKAICSDCGFESGSGAVAEGVCIDALACERRRRGWA